MVGLHPLSLGALHQLEADIREVERLRGVRQLDGVVHWLKAMRDRPVRSFEPLNIGALSPFTVVHITILHAPRPCPAVIVESAS